MDFKKKYIKYKTKYIDLKKQEGGVKFFESFFKRTQVQENLLKPIVTDDDGLNNNPIVTLPKGSRLYHITNNEDLKLLNKPTYFAASPIGAVIMAPNSDDRGRLKYHKKKLYNTMYILTLKSDVDFVVESFDLNKNIIRPYGSSGLGSSALTFLDSYGIKFQEILIKNPTNHEFEKSILKPIEFGSVNLFLAKFPFEDFLGKPKLEFKCQLTRLQKVKIKKKWKDYKIKNYLKEEPILGYMKYSLTNFNSVSFEYKINSLNNFLNKKKEKYENETLMLSHVDIIEDNESTDHNLPLWIPQSNYIITTEDKLLKEITKSINLKKFNKKVIFNFKLFNKFYELINNFKSKLLKEYIFKFTQSNNYYLSVSDEIKKYLKPKIEKEYDLLLEGRILKIDWYKIFKKIGIIDDFSDEDNFENFDIYKKINYLVNFNSFEKDGKKYIKKYRVKDLEVKILEIDNNNKLFFGKDNNDTITNFVNNMDNNIDFNKYFEIEDNIFEISFLIFKKRYIENFDLEKQEELLNELKKEKKDNYNVKKFEELKSLYFLKLIIKEYKNDILKDPDMVIVFNNLIENLKIKLEN